MPVPANNTARLPIGPRLKAVLALAWRARRAVMLTGESGIGKSAIVPATAAELGIGCRVLDLSLLEPPDLTGLPYIEEGRTRFAPPALLPSEGEGILVLEELNRAERCVRQPVLQLLSAGRLNDYVLPEGWSIAVSINPNDGSYQVDELDPALIKRFMVYETFADRAEWLAWARPTGLHGAVLEVARRHERLLDELSPRTWQYVSDLLWALERGGDASERLARDALLGYLPTPWVEAVLAARRCQGDDDDIDVGDLLSASERGAQALARLAAMRDRGRTDVLERVAYGALEAVTSDDLSRRAREGAFDLAAFERLLQELPGDHADRLQSGFGHNPDAGSLVGIGVDRVLDGFTEFGAADEVGDWLARRATRHRAWALTTAVVEALDRRADLEAVRGSRSARVGLGALLACLKAPHDRRFRDALVQLRIDPIMPTGMRHCAA